MSNMNEIKSGQIYRHFKGHVIKIITVGTNTETMEEMVVYEHQGNKKIWIRPLEMFLNKEDVSGRVDNTTGQKYRFELINE